MKGVKLTSNRLDCNRTDYNALISLQVNCKVLRRNLERLQRSSYAAVIRSLDSTSSSQTCFASSCVRKSRAPSFNGHRCCDVVLDRSISGTYRQRCPAHSPSAAGHDLQSVATVGGVPAPDAVPVHPRALNGLYFLYLCACLVERTWRFALPLVLANVEGGFQAIAMLGFVSNLACSLIGPAVGRMLDRMYRPYGLGTTTALQGVAIIASGLVVLAAASNPVAAISEGPVFVALLLLSMVERLMAIASELAIERDWVTQLSGKDNASALAKSNAMLRRTDLTCEFVGSLAFGWLYTKAGVAASVATATMLATTILPIQLYCIIWIARQAPDAMIHGRDEADIALFRQPWKRLLSRRGKRKYRNAAPVETGRPLARRIQDQVVHSLDGWKVYFRQPILPSSLTFVILFFNVALSPGGLITAFLTAKGLDGTAMALFRGGCATMGFVGTWVGRRLIRRFGLMHAGTRALAIQGIFLFIATLTYAAFLSGPLTAVVSAGPSIGGVPLTLVAFSVAVVCSRVGMWSYDMVNAQMFQQTVSQREVASASSAEMALCNFSELIMQGLAAYVFTLQTYSTLIYISFSAVAVANMVFGGWVRRVHRDADEDEGPAVITVAAAA